MENVKVVITVKYEWDTYNQKPIATITVSLPADEEGEIHEMTRNGNVYFFNERLHSVWGELDNYDSPIRYKVCKVDADKAMNYIDEEIKKIREVIEKNRKEVNNLSQPQTFIYEI